MTTNTKYARLLSATKHYIFLLLLASLFLLAACSSGGGGSNPSAKTSQSNLSIADATAFEGAGVVELVVSLNATSDSATSFYYRTQDGSASATVDYLSVTKKTAAIAAGKSTTIIYIVIIDDKKVEDAESFVVKIFDSSSNSLLDTATATIKIDDLPSLAIANASALENAGRIKFTASLSEVFPNNIVSFDYATIAGSASADIDYTSVSSTASIQAGNTTAEIFVDIINDASIEGDEGDEVFEVKISNPVNTTISKELALGVIKGELASLFIADATALENAGRIKFVVTLSQLHPETVFFDYRTIAGSASATIDYTSVSSGRATIDIGDTTAEIFINIINDASVEDDETFYLEISSPQPNIPISRASARGTIKIDELPSLAITDATALEDAGSIKFLVSLSEAFAGNIVSFNYRIIAGSASADLDYLPYPRTVSINAGEATTELSVAIINDTLIEDDETLFVEISNPYNATINKNRARATGTIKIDDLPMLTIADATAFESDSSIKFTVSLSEAFPGNDVSFDYHTIAGSAMAGDDYTAVFDTTSIKAGDTTAEIFIYISDDTLVEDDETFYLVISNPINASINENKARGTATIKIDDLPSLSIKDATTLESAGRIKFTVSLSEVFPGNLVSLSYETMPSSASADLDYASSVGTASIQAGEATTEIVIKIVNDTLIEDDETFFVKITNPINATIDENRARATATIKIDDLPSLAIANASATDNAELIKFTVSLSEAFVGNPVFFDYATSPISASADIDYTSVSSTTSISAGDTTTEIVIELIDDTNTEGDEGDEVFEVKISNPVSYPVRATISKELALGVIKGELASLFIADATALENAGRIKFTVSLSKALSNQLSFDYRTIAGSASATIDYTSSVGTATIDIDDTSTEIFIDISDDSEVEDDETFYLAISSTQPNIPISRERATATIKIDDLPSLAITDATTFEDAGRIKFTASLSEAFPGNLVSFDYETIPISASANLDYTPFSNRISIAAGETRAEIFIDIINDAIIEDDETFALVISNPHNASITRDRATATIKINDLSLSIADASAFENEGSIKLTVSLSAPFPSNKAVVFNYHTLDIASASSGDDYTGVVAGRATIAAGETSTEIVIDLSDDSITEDDETFLVIISPNQLDIPISRASATATIKIDDIPSLSIAGSSVAEENKDGSISFLVTLSEAFPGNDVSFDYHTIPISASTQDYTSVSSRASIQAGETATSIFIDISNDSLPEDAETFMVIISNPYNATIDKNRASAIGTIKINDLSLSIADSSVKENVGSIKLTVSLSAPFPSSKAVVFNYRTLETTSANSASSGDDYTSVVAGRATIDIDDTTTEIVIDLSDDSIIEDDETFLVIISTNQLDIPISRARATATIKIDDIPSLSIAGSSAAEENEDGSISFLVTLSEAFPGNDVSFDYYTLETTSSNSASSGDDYTGVVAGRASIQASYTATEIVIDISDDTLVEDAETFMVVISNPYNATIDISQATGTIKISDLSLSIADASAFEDAGSIKLKVSLSESFPGNKDVVFNYATIAGSASAGADYTSVVAGRATIDIGDTSTKIMIDISDDSEVEDIETFLVVISPNQLDIPISRASATASIKIDDLPSLSIAGSSAAEKDGSISFRVTLSEAFPDNLVSFDYRTIDTGSASSGDDYTSKAGRATIASGELTTSIFINLSDDTLVEDAETFLVEISSPYNATIDISQATGTIEIDDKPSLSITGSSAAESAGSIKFTVSLSEAFPGNDVSFDYRTIAGSAIAGDDYTAVDDATSIKAGDTTAEIFIKITQDTDKESDEVFSVEISNPTNASIGEGLASGFITGEIPILFITGGSAIESAGSIKFLVTLSRKTDNDVSFDYETIAISAIEGVDYHRGSGRETIKTGEVTTDILIGIITDASIEDAETFIVKISNPSNATIDISQATGTIKINGLSLSIADASAFEDAGSIKLRVSLSEPFPSRKAVAFNYRTQDTGSPNSAIAGADYTSIVDGRATIDIGKTSTEIMIDISDDSIVEDIESFFVVISPNQLDIPISEPQAIASIKIDDLPSLSIAGSSVAENAGVVTFTASLSESFPRNTDVSFDYQTKRGSANNKIVWQQALAHTSTQSPKRWAARNSHQTVVFKNRMWVLGGAIGSSKPFNDVWHSADGKDWTRATEHAGWIARHYHTSVVFNNRMWVLGGVNEDFVVRNDIWDSTNGADWNRVKDNNNIGWETRFGHTSVVFKGKMWVLGGQNRNNRFKNKNDVWDSTNGADWRKVTSNAAWTTRFGQSSVVFDGKMWLLGGQIGFNNYRKDVWYSTNGKDWYPATTNAAWEARRLYKSVVFDDKIWVLGGQKGLTNSLNDVWYSSNGADWSRLTAESSWVARRSHSSVVFGDKIWVLGGEHIGSIPANDIHFAYAAGDYLSASSTGTILGGEHSTTIDITLLDDDILELTDESFDIIISQPINATINAASGDNQATASILADTASWSEATSDASWSARYAHSSVVFDNKIWVLGGSSSGSNTSDVWYSSNGINWARATTDADWEARSSQSSVVFGNKIWVLGGRDNQGDKDDVWYSTNGKNWSKASTSNIWSARQNHSSVVFRDKMWVLGGRDNQGDKKDVWYSTDGNNWSEVSTSNIWSARQNHSSVVYKGRVWVLGGNDGSYKNDVWSSNDGSSWAEATTDANWEARSEHSSVVFDNKMWVLGGSDGSDKNDVWYSTDGKNWSEVTTISIWDARDAHSSVVFRDKIWVLGGKDNIANKNDVWFLSELDEQ